MQELLNYSQLIYLFCIVITFPEVGHVNGFGPQVMCNREEPLIKKTKKANHARECSWILSSIGFSPPRDLSLATGVRLWVTGLQNITASDLLFSGNRDSAAPSIVSGGKTQTRQWGDASGDVKRKLKVFSPITDPRAQETTKTATVFTLFFFAFLTNDFELNSSFWQSWPHTKARLCQSYANITATTMLLYLLK